MRDPKKWTFWTQKVDFFKPHPPCPPTKTLFLAHFVAKSGPFGRFGGGATHPPHPPWLRACFQKIVYIKCLIFVMILCGWKRLHITYNRLYFIGYMLYRHPAYLSFHHHFSCNISSILYHMNIVEEQVHVLNVFAKNGEKTQFREEKYFKNTIQARG